MTIRHHIAPNLALTLNDLIDEVYKTAGRIPRILQAPSYLKRWTPSDTYQEFWAVIDDRKAIAIDIFNDAPITPTIISCKLENIPLEAEFISEAEFFEAYDRALSIIQSRFQRVETI